MTLARRLSSERLDMDTMIAEAILRTGLSDFGGESFREPMGALIESLVNEANLNQTGNAIQRERMTGILATRLQTQAYLRKYPEILAEEICAPIVIAGLPRTGSTLLHRVLASDPRFYTALWYEVRFPAPGQDWDLTAANDSRIARANTEIQSMLAGNPDLISMHPFDAVSPDEEFLLLENSFYSTAPSVTNHIPGYNRWLEARDNTVGYRLLRQQLQFLQWQKRVSGRSRGAVRWLLKTPHHLHCMSVLLDVFPDARVIQIHRDPLETIPSVCSLIEALCSLGSDIVDPVAIGREWSTKYARGMLHTMQVRHAQQSTFFDATYDQLTDSLESVVSRIYGFIGLDWTADLRQTMAHWQHENRRELRPEHHYDLARYGLSEESLQVLFADYRKTFIPHAG